MRSIRDVFRRRGAVELNFPDLPGTGAPRSQRVVRGGCPRGVLFGIIPNPNTPAALAAAARKRARLESSKA